MSVINDSVIRDRRFPEREAHLRYDDSGCRPVTGCMGVKWDDTGETSHYSGVEVLKYLSWEDTRPFCVEN